MFHFVLGLHLVLCVSLIGLVLLQQGKGADAGAAFGGGSNTLFGASGANSIMVKVTTACAVLFMVTSIFLIRGYSELQENAGLTKGIQINDSDFVPAEKAPEPATPESAPASK